MTFQQAIAPETIDIQPPLGQLLLQRGVISENDVAKALSFQASFGGLLGAILIRIGAVAEDAVLEALAQQLDFSVISNERMPQDPALYATTIKASGIDSDWWIDQAALAWTDDKGVLHCISRDPLSTNRDFGEVWADLRIEPVAIHAEVTRGIVLRADRLGNGKPRIDAAYFLRMSR